MAVTYTLISSSTLGSSTSSVTFSSIPNTYTDLALRITARSTRASASSNGFTINLNGATSNYSYTELSQNGTTASSSRDTISGGNTYLYGGVIAASNLDANTFSTFEIYIPAYTSSQNKPVSITSVMENNASTPYEQHLVSGLYSSTTTISSVTLKSSDGGFNFAANSSFYLYGIKNS